MNGLCNVLVFKCDVNTANKAQRTHGEGKPPTDRREVTDGSPINSAALSLPPDMPNMCHLVIWGTLPSQVLFQVPLSWATSIPICRQPLC